MASPQPFLLIARQHQASSGEAHITYHPTYLLRVNIAAIGNVEVIALDTSDESLLVLGS